MAQHSGRKIILNNMDTTDKKARLELLRKSSPEIQNMYGDEEVGNVLTTVANNLGITEDKSYEVLALAFGDIILGLYKKTSLPQILKDRLQLTDDQITLAMEELKELLEKIPEAATAADYVNVIPPTTIVPPTAPTPINEPLVTVKPMRTFPDDFNAGRAHSYGAFRPEGEDNDGDEPIHSSSQDDVLRK